MKKPRIVPGNDLVKTFLGLLASFVLILSYIVACSDNDPVEDQPILPDPIADEIPDPIVDEDLITVDTDGGVFVLPSGIEVSIPQGAVTEEKEMKVEVLDLTAVNALAPSPISETSSFVSGISFATEDFDFKEPIKIKIPVLNLTDTSLPFLYEMQGESNTWLFANEELVVSRDGNYIQIILKESHQNNAGKEGGMEAQIPFADIRSFFITLYEYVFYGIDPCKKSGAFTIATLDVEYASSEGCQVVNSSHEVVFWGCDPPPREPYTATEIHPSCEPQLTISPEGKLKVKKGESIPIKLTTIIGKFPLKKQEIRLNLSDNLYTPSQIIYTDSTGYVSFNVRGSELGEGKITLTVLYKYYLTTLFVEANGEKETGFADPKERTEEYTINIEVYEKLKVTTDAVTNFTSTTATVSGNVTDDGGETVTERGVYWGKSAEPENKLPLGSGLGGFIGNLADLEPDTEYYVKAYAINKDTTAYGEIVSFKTLEEKCTVTTTLDTEYDCESATVGGTVTCEGDATATERGIYLDGVKIQSGSGTGSFIVELTDLEENTSYTVMAYVTNDAGTTKNGEQITFTTPECELKDIDGNVYKTVKIGTQVWMAENLKTTTYNDGSSIVLETDPWEWLTDEPRYSWYNNDISNKDIYGALYNWYAVGTGKLCPLGWHVSSREDYQTLMDYVGGADIAAGKLKERGTTHWYPPNTGATNEYGFTALPGGHRKAFWALSYEDGDESFIGLGEHGVWWTSSTSSGTSPSPYAFGMSYDYEDSEMGPSTAYWWGYSCRCVKD